METPGRSGRSWSWANRPQPFRVAIVGAGIAGLTAAIALNHFFPDLDSIQITIYEKVEEVREVGASIAINPSGLRILDKLGVEYEDFSIRQSSGRPMVYRHWKTNEEIGHDDVKGHVDEKHHVSRFHRAHLQWALMQALPRQVELRLGMKLVQATSKQDRVILNFENDYIYEADLLIGADGIHSLVRGSFVPDHQLKWTGRVAYRSTLDASLVDGIEDLPGEAIFWVGHERDFFASRLAYNQYAIIGSVYRDPNDTVSLYRDAKWDGIGDVKFLRSLYEGWHPIVQSILEAVPDTKTYPNYAGTALKSLVLNHRVLLLGDAGHTHGGAFAAGASLAINDAYALALSLAHVHTQGGQPTYDQVQRALRLYDATRMPLVTKVLDMVHSPAEWKRWNGNGPDGEVESDEELRARVARRPDMSWLMEHDVDAEFQKVVQSLEAKAETVKSEATVEVTEAFHGDEN